MMKKLWIFTVIPFILVACNSEKEEEIDAEKFCQCRRQNIEYPEKCNALLQELSDKYAFDPEGYEKLRDAIEVCLPNDEK